MSDVSVRQFTHRKLLSVVVWCLESRSKFGLTTLRWLLRLWCYHPPKTIISVRELRANSIQVYALKYQGLIAPAPGRLVFTLTEFHFSQAHKNAPRITL